MLAYLSPRHVYCALSVVPVHLAQCSVYIVTPSRNWTSSMQLSKYISWCNVCYIWNVRIVIFLNTHRARGKARRTCVCLHVNLQMFAFLPEFTFRVVACMLPQDSHMRRPYTLSKGYKIKSELLLVWLGIDWGVESWWLLFLGILQFHCTNRFSREWFQNSSIDCQ